jgi:UDP:flavonoid glycosyltransferase YjiC (YdhE family)
MVSTPAACSPKAGLTATAANTSPVSCGSGNSRGGSTITPSLAAATLLLQQQQQQQQQQPSQWTPPANLAAFLSNGAPPVYIGFGSLVCAGDNTWLSQLVWEATQQLAGSCRVVVATGWGLMAGVSGHTWGDHVALVTEAPHDWLFPR